MERKGNAWIWIVWNVILGVIVATRFLAGYSFGWSVLSSKIPEPIPLALTVVLAIATARPVKRLWLPTLIALSLSLAVLQPSWGRPRPIQGGDIKVLQYNIEHGLGDVNGVARVIEREAADVVVLEETGPLEQLPDYRSPRLDRSLEPYQVVRKRFEAVGVRGKITGDRFIDLPSMPRESKLATVVEATIRGVDLYVMSVHLSPMQVERQPIYAWPEYLRRYSEVHTGQIDILCHLIESADRPVILAGDFNLYATGPWHRKLSNLAQDTHRSVGLGLGYTMPTSLPVERIDYIWSRGLQPIDLTVLPDRASDHRAVVAWFRPNGYNSR